MIPRRTACALVVVAALAAGCSPRPHVTYVHPNELEVLTPEWGPTDLQTTADRMVDSLLRYEEARPGRTPVIQVSRVRNRTSEHIDTYALTDRIRTAMLQTGHVRFTAVSDLNREMIDSLEYQANSGYVDPATAARIGRQVGADYFLYGGISSIVKRAGRSMDVYYQVTLNLVDLETGLIAWSDQTELRKEAWWPLIGI